MPVDKTPQEEGFPHADPLVGGQIAPGGSKWITPHADQYVSMLNMLSRTYYWTHDEALRDSGVCNTDAMWADLVISTAIRDRQRPVVQLEWQLECRNPSDPEEKKWAQIVKEILDDIPNFQQLRRCLLDAIWWGRAGVQFVCDWDYSQGERRIAIRKWEQIHGDTLVFKFDGTVGYLVNSQLAGKPGTSVIEGRGGYAKFLTPDEDQCVLVHEFEPMASDFYRPEMAGSIKGTGYRGRVYWYWWMKHNLMRILFDFVRKVGNGFFLAGYAAGNRTELEALQTSLESQTGKPIIYVPVDGNRTLKDTLEHLPVSLQGADFQWTVINALNGLIRDAILGNSMANKAAPVGIGGSQGDHMGMTDDERVKYDAKDLEAPLQKLVNMIYKNIAPHVRPAKFTHLADKRQPGEIMESANWFMQAGGGVPKPWAQEQLGIPEPNEGEEVLSLVQAQQATALQGTPAGVPQAGPGGPAPGMDGGGQPQQGQVDPNVAAQIQPMPIQAFRDDSDVIRMQREFAEAMAHMNANTVAIQGMKSALDVLTDKLNKQA